MPKVLESHYVNKKIFVADNGSTDDSLNVLATFGSSIVVLKNNKNLGFAGGYNWALKQIDSPYFILLNSDVEVTPNWLEPIIDLMEIDRTIGAVQPKILSYKQPNYFEYAGACGGWIDYLGYPFSRGRVFDVLEEDKGQYQTVQSIFWATGAALFIRRELYLKLDGFDERFFAHQEEIDLCWRLQSLGYSIKVCPQSEVFHIGAGTLPRGGKKVFLNFRNNLWMLCKNLPFKEKIWKLPLRFTLDGISAWKGLIKGDVFFFKAIVQAHLAIIALWMKGELKPQKNRKPMYFFKGVLHKPIAYKHFVKGINKFTDLVKNNSNN